MSDALLKQLTARKLSVQSVAAGLTFQHHSPNLYVNLRPVPYTQIAAERQSGDYVLSRYVHEQAYHRMVEGHDPTHSFLYATVVRRNKMQTAAEYPGYTYFFKLSVPEIERCIFEVVDKKFPMAPQCGLLGLRSALAHWDSHRDDVQSYEDSVAEGIIDPRIEVIIPFKVEFFDFVPQIEDR